MPDLCWLRSVSPSESTAAAQVDAEVEWVRRSKSRDAGVYIVQ
uniref:SH2 domain-containing protein n=1 Tax=Steinernema glaseri TaxID=37863 RepID=A0A1I8A1F8_9BILA